MKMIHYIPHSMILLFVLLVLRMLTSANATAIQLKPKPTNDSGIREMISELLTDYDRTLRPNYLGSPVHVLIDATILSFANLDAINMMYTVDMFFRQKWKDHRLAHSLKEPLTITVGNKHPADVIWTPDTVFENSVTSSMHHVTVNNHKVDIHPDGTVFWGTRVTVSPTCHMNLRSYPMDIQHCKLILGSYTYDTSHLLYRWRKVPGITILNTKMAQFDLEKFDTTDKKINYVAGYYKVLIARFEFKRQMGYAILQIYVPSIAIVSVSWVSLWIRRNATPARVSLCITTLLTISTIWASVNATLPRVNYVKAIDIFMMTSFVCVVLTLLEYTLVLNCGAILNLLRKKMKKKKMLYAKEKDKVMPLIGSYFVSKEYNNEIALKLLNPFPKKGDQSKESTKTPRLSKRYEYDEKKAEQMKKKRLEEDEKLAAKIDICARVFFPFVYTLFNVFYWTNFLLTHETSEDHI